VFLRIIGIGCLKKKYISYHKRADKFIIKHQDYTRAKIQKTPDGVLLYNEANWTNYDDF
jgi:hypothetical protein